MCMRARVCVCLCVCVRVRACVCGVTDGSKILMITILAIKQILCPEL